jgi:hypothetical protein
MRRDFAFVGLFLPPSHRRGDEARGGTLSFQWSCVSPLRNKTAVFSLSLMAHGRRRAMQHNSPDGRTIKAANAAQATTYKPSLISLKGSYVAMIFRRPLCQNPLDLRKK